MSGGYICRLGARGGRGKLGLFTCDVTRGSSRLGVFSVTSLGSDTLTTSMLCQVRFQEKLSVFPHKQTEHKQKYEMPEYFYANIQRCEDVLFQ